jgi:hypothetical protein
VIHTVIWFLSVLQGQRLTAYSLQRSRARPSLRAV